MTYFNFINNSALAKFAFGVLFSLMSVAVTAQIDLTIQIQKPTCYGFTNGEASVIATGGQAPYTYLWSNGMTSSTAWSLTAGEYSVVVTDANGLTATESVTLTEPSPLEGTILPSGDACNPTMYGAMASGGTSPYTYAWNTGESTMMIQNPSVSFLMVTITDPFGCHTVATSPVNSGLTVTVETDDITCNGYNDGVASLSVTGGVPPFTYQWNHQNSSDVYISNLPEGYYEVTVTDANGCSGVAGGQVNNPPATQVTIVKDPECGIPATVTAYASGGVEPHMFMWMLNGDLLSTDSFYVFTEPGTLYLCTMDGNHCPFDNWVTVAPGFDLNANVTDATCNSTGSIDLMPSTVVGPVTYNWEGPNGFTANSEDIDNLESGTYSVTAVDAGGCTATYTANVGMTSLSGDFSYTLNSCANNELEVQFNSMPNDPSITGWEWSFNSNEQNPMVTFNDSNLPETVSLTIYYGDNCESTIEKPLNLNVLDVTAPGDQSVCADDALALTITNNSNDPSVTYQWAPSNLIVSGGNTSSAQINTETPGSYVIEVTMTNSAGCTVTELIPLEIDDPAAYALDPSLISYKQCDGMVVDLVNNNPNADLFTWEFPDGTTDTDASTSFDFDGSTPGAYDILLIPANGTCADNQPIPIDVGEARVADFTYEYLGCEDTVEVKFFDQSVVPGPITYAWEFVGNDTFTDTKSDPVITFVNETDINARLTIFFPEDCELTIEKELTLSSISHNIPDSVNICDNAGVELNPGGDPSYTSYTWEPTTGLSFPHGDHNPVALPDASQLYTVEIIDIQGHDTCIVAKEIMVNVAPVNLTIPDDETICDPNEVTTLGATYSGSDHVEWYSDSALTDLLSSDDTYDALPGTYYALVENEYGCSSVESVTITANPAEAEADTDLIPLCLGDQATLLLNNLDPTDNLTVTWSLDGVPLTDPTIEPTESGIYIATAINQDGCEIKDTVAVEVNDITDLITVGASESPIFKSQSTHLMATTGYSYEWSPSNTLDDPNASDPIATPTETTTYTVTVTDTETGCTTVKSITIEVKETECGEPNIFLPNAFSPNGDGYNDVLYLRGLNLDEIHLSIYNRWGQVVFETRDQTIGWYGYFNDKMVVPDVYGFYLRVKCDGEEFFKKGNVSVIR